MRATKRAADLSSQLQIARADQADERIACDLNDLVRESIDDLEPRLTDKATLALSLADHLPLLSLAPTLIQRAIVNILVNAVESLDTATGEMRIATETFTVAENTRQGYQQNLPPGTYVSLRISDSGHGMDQAVLEQIFEPYYSTKSTGSGLGLTIARHVVQLHQGIIEVHSAPQTGTSFRVLFPL
ncbi:MAG: ATP-binding protein [Caldilineaceae bacterium]